MQEIMVKIDNVSKQYHLGQIGGTTLRDELQRWRAKRRGEEDPTKIIGSKDVNKGEIFKALDGVSFEVKKGERVGIIGHNGAGKSTLLKLISRVTAPSAGKIGLNGRVASMLEVGTGFHPELTGRENIYMNGAILGMTKKEIDAKMEDIIEFSECRQFIDTPVKRYSSGMYVKLAFSVAAHLDSEILIMDEVLAVGDMAFQKKCLEKMSAVSTSEGRTILYVSHNMNTIRQLCNRVVVLSHGKIVFDGGVEEGIAVYTGLVEKCDVHYIYTDAQRKFDDDTLKTKLIGLDILDRESAVYQKGEIIEFVLHLFCNESCDNVKLRLELYAGGGIVGTVLLRDSFQCRKGETMSVTLQLPTNNFVPAKYTAIALSYDCDQYGDQKRHDRIDAALVFEIRDDNGESVHWETSCWGYVQFEDMILKNSILQ